jgi:hypothetical protein
MRAAWYERKGSAHEVLIARELPDPVFGLVGYTSDIHEWKTIRPNGSVQKRTPNIRTCPRALDLPASAKIARLFNNDQVKVPGGSGGRRRPGAEAGAAALRHPGADRAGSGHESVSRYGG